MLYNTIAQYPSLDVKYPYVSPFSLIAYQQILLTGHLLLMDIHHRPQTSQFANAYRQDNGLNDFLTLLTQCTVPSDLDPLITQLTSVRDPSRPDLVFVLNLGSFTWNHDFGRLDPPHILIIAHNIIASLRTNQTPDNVLLAFYNTIVCHVAELPYTVSEMLGGWYRLDNANRLHPNWMNSAVEELFNPVVGRALTNRPSLAKIRVAPAQLGPVLACNPYSAMFNMNGDNLAPLSAMMNNISKFIENAKLGSKTLLQISGDASGITCLSHSLEPPTLPTWHKLPNATAADPVQRTDEQYAFDLQFMRPKTLANENLQVPTAAQCLPLLALVVNNDCTLDNNPFPEILFDPHFNVYPPALYFQPYDRSCSTLNYTVTLGLKIETGELDGVSLPIPNVRNSLFDTNSRYRSGTIPVSQIHQCTYTEAQPLTLSARTLHYEIDDPRGLAIVDSTRVVLPRFGNAHVERPGAALPGFDEVAPVPRPRDAFTYAATHGNDDYPVGSRKFYVWSSYRYTVSNHPRHRNVHMYYTFRAMFGLDIPLSATENPARILPH